MANTTLQLRKSGQSGNVPSSLSFGELALNYADGRLYYKHANNSIASISTGSPTQSFATINANSSLILATSPSDTLSIIPGNNITITTDTFGKSIIINSTAAGVGDSSFGQIVANGSTILATTSNDSLQIVGESGISVSSNVSAKKVIVSVPAGFTFTTADYGFVTDSTNVIYDYGTL